jgi:Protein of unknown function (DUF2815)
MELILKDARIAFPRLFTPYSNNPDGSDPKFSATFLFKKDDDNYKETMRVMSAVAADKWGAQGAKTLKELTDAGKICLRDGNLKEKYSGFAGNMFVAASNGDRVLVTDRKKKMLEDQDGLPYAGCYVWAGIEVWAQDNNYGRRINAKLKWVMFSRDGEAFGGGAPASLADLPDLPDVEDDEALA